MVPSNDESTEKESRPPTLKDIVSLASDLNEKGAKYVIIGGLAVVQQGFTRATEDIDLLIARDSANIQKVIDAVGNLEDHTARELTPKDFDEYEVIRVADEIVVDLMVSASGLDYRQAMDGIILVEVEGVSIPFAGLELLLKMKQGVREKDILDRKFLEQIQKKSR